MANGNFTNITATGTISATGNITGSSIISRGTSITAAGLISAAGNITGGNISAVGNIKGGNISITGSFNPATLSVPGNITGNNVSGQIVSASVLSATGYAIVGTNRSNYISSAGNVVAAGNIAAGNVIATEYFIGNGSQLTGITTTYGNTNATSLMASFGSNNISTSGTVTAGTVVSAVVSATGNITGGNIRSLGSVTSTGNIVAPNFIGNGVGTPTLSSATNLDLSAVAAVRVVGGGTFRLPSMTTTQRDALIAVNGDVIYNTTLGKFQGYQAGAWVNLA